MKFIIAIILMTFTTVSVVSQNDTIKLHFTTSTVDTIVKNVNVAVLLDKLHKKCYVTNFTENSKKIYLVNRLSVADKYHLVDVQDSTTKQKFSIEIFLGRKPYLSIENSTYQKIYYK